MANPIFGQLTRDWGHSIRFIGVDRHQCIYDFRSLLTDVTLRRLVAALARWLHDDETHDGLPMRAAETATLDVLFAALGENMLTILEARRDDWGAHLARECRCGGAQARLRRGSKRGWRTRARKNHRRAKCASGYPHRFELMQVLVIEDDRQFGCGELIKKPRH